MKIIELIKNNSKLYMLMGIIIFFGTIGVTLAALVESFNAIAINTTTSSIDANITYDVGTNTAEVINNGNLLPISDDLVTGLNVTDPRILKVSFNVSGENTNPDNTIYDIAMYFNELDCELRTSDLKWRLYKNNELLNFGSLSPTYDTMAKNRLVLTNIQEDLTTNEDKYVFLLWISESCTGDITTCDPSLDQSKYLNKVLKGNIKVELSTGSKKAVERITASEGTCDYIETELPVCNTLTYNGNEQTLLRGTTNNYTINNNTGVKAGNYLISLKLNEGYKWTDGSIDDKKIYCSINKKSATVTSKDQTIVYGSNISSEVSNVNSSGLLTGNTINKVTLNSSIYDVGTGNINVDFVQIQDSQGNDITNNYNIDKKGTGKVTINCSNTAEEPTIVDKDYSGLNQIGVTNGKYIEVSGNKIETEIGSYTINVVPQKNYCWSDGTTTAREYTWEIVPGKLNISLTNKTEAYTGSKINISDAIITDASGNRVFDIDVTYKYYNGNTCTGNALEDAPVNAGNYSVKAFSKETEDYDASESNCATLTITKAEGSITSNTETLLLIPNEPDTFKYTTRSEGNVTCSSSNTNIATCSVDTSTKTVTVTPVSSGSTTITLSLEAGTNYNTSSTTVSVEVEEISTATFYYYDGTSITSTTSICVLTGTETSCSLSVPSVVSSSVGPDGAAYYGVSNNISSNEIIANITSKNENYYAVYKGSWTATYTKDETVESIGSTSNSCTNYKTTDGTTYSSTNCSVTLPSINLSSYYDEPAWYDSNDTKVGNAEDSITLSANATYTAKARYLEASNFSYDNSNTGAECSDVSCMLDKLYAITRKQDATMTTSTSSLSLTYGASGTFTYTYDGDGEVTCLSSSSSVATCSVNTSTNTVTVTPITNGSATITLKASQGLFYNATSKTVSVDIVKNLNATFYYYDGSSTASTTSICTLTGTATSCSLSIPSEVSSSTGPDGSTYYGISSSTSSSTITTSPNTASGTNYYAVYEGSWTATYTKDDTVSSIGSTSNSCTNYKTTNGTTYSSTNCSVTLPSINVTELYAPLGWYNSSNIKVGNAGDSITLTSNATYTAKAERTRYYATEFTYDNTNTGVECTDVSCMLDKLYDLVK